MRGKKEEPLKIPSIESLRAELAREEARCSRRRVLWNMAAALIIAAAVAGLVLTRIYALIEVDGNSMEPTLSDGEILFLRRTKEVGAGDIAGFYYEGKILLKRVIGMPGDEIEIDTDGNVSVNGQPLEEPYLREKSLEKCQLEFPVTVPEGTFFVLGDNRAVSVDSRDLSVGYVRKDQVVGRAVIKAWPPARMKIWK
ncbi:MAG: signal peptidase I [Lachnospiraceae bacterium]|nr:signal peptidase I [Lachnospiraceae bacterium]